MKKTISIVVLMIYLLVALDIPTAFAYSEGTSLLAIETLSTEKDNKLIQFNPYITELGSIGIHLEVIKDDILNRGDISLTVVSPDDVIPLYEGKVPLENFDFAITNIEKK